MTKKPLPQSSTDCWDKAKWHTDAEPDLSPDVAVEHILAVLRFLDSKGQLSSQGQSELSGSMGEDTGLFPDHMDPPARAFLDRCYSSYAEQCDYGKAPPIGFLEEQWTQFASEYGVPRPSKGPDAKLKRALTRLARKSKENAVGPEDLFAVARLGTPEVVPKLRQLDEEHGWVRLGVGSEGYIPMGTWNDCVCAFLEGGYDALVELILSDVEGAKTLADGGGAGAYGLSLLEELRTAESIEALRRIVRQLLSEDDLRFNLALECAEAINTLGSLADAGHATDERELLHRLLAPSCELSPAQACTVYNALGWVGTTESIHLIESREPLGYPYDGLERDVAKQVKKRG